MNAGDFELESEEPYEGLSSITSFQMLSVESHCGHNFGSEVCSCICSSDWSDGPCLCLADAEADHLGLVQALALPHPVSWPMAILFSKADWTTAKKAGLASLAPILTPDTSDREISPQAKVALFAS